MIETKARRDARHAMENLPIEERRWFIQTLSWEEPTRTVLAGPRNSKGDCAAKVQIASIKVFGERDHPPIAALAVMNVSLDGEIVVRRCLLVEDDRGRRVIPPRGRGAGDCPILWGRETAIARQINAAGIAAFGAMMVRG